MVELPNYPITMNTFEAGLLAGLIDSLDERRKQALSHVFKQLIDLKKQIDKECGVVRTLLPNGMLELKDNAGNRIVRPPYSWEVEGN